MDESVSPPKVTRRAAIAIGGLTLGVAAVGADLAAAPPANAWPSNWPPIASDYAEHDIVAPAGFVQPFTDPMPRISSAYMSYRDCVCSNPHVGTDYSDGSIKGRAFYSIGPGSVVSKGYASSMGNYIGISHGNGIYSRYLHMDVASKLSVGQTVKAGTLIGYVGTAGAGTNNYHLHLEVCVNNGTQYQSPEVFLSNSPTAGNTTTTLNLEDEMIMITSSGRGSAVIGPGYFKSLSTDEQVAQAKYITSKQLTGNDRQFDVWKAIALQGSAA